MAGRVWGYGYLIHPSKGYSKLQVAIMKMPNPLIGYDDLQYHNHDPDDDVDEEWFKGRDEWV